MKTRDGLTVYDLDPNAAELWVVAGPEGYDPKAIDTDNLPDGFRWVEDEEWEEMNVRELADDHESDCYEDEGEAAFGRED